MPHEISHKSVLHFLVKEMGRIHSLQCDHNQLNTPLEMWTSVAFCCQGHTKTSWIPHWKNKVSIKHILANSFSGNYRYMWTHIFNNISCSHIIWKHLNRITKHSKLMCQILPSLGTVYDAAFVLFKLQQ